MRDGSLSEAADWRLKVQLYAVLSVAFCTCYFTLQRFPIVPTRTLPLTALDHTIGFHPNFIYVYQSVYVMVPLFPFLATTKSDLMRYVHGFVWLCGICFVIFLLVPIVCPRPDDNTSVAMFRLMLLYDGKINTIPSLHVGLSVYSALFGYELAKAAPGIRPLVWMGVAWTTLIAYSAAATKQHYVADIPPGIALAWVVHRYAFQKSRAA